MNPQNGQTPLDYLNQISPEAPKPTRFGFHFNLKTVLLLGVIVIIVMIVLANISSAISNARVEPWERFSARLATTGDIVDDSSSKIKNSQLRSLNSDLKLYITNTQRDLAVPLSNINVNPAQLPATITTEEAGTEMIDRLEDGRLNAKYDSTYAREMTYQTATLLSLIQQLYSISGTEATKEFLTTAYDNLVPTYKALSEFSASNE